MLSRLFINIKTYFNKREPVYNPDEFVRHAVLKKIYKRLKQGNSIKLFGIPNIGITSIMRQIAIYSRTGGLWNNDFIVFYIGGRYDLNNFRNTVASRLKESGYKVPEKIPHTIKEICKIIIESVTSHNSQKRIIFLLDDFQKNLHVYNQNKKDDYTVLTEQGIDDIRHLAEYEKTKIGFIVHYTFPIDSELISTDWYLNNFKHITIDMLSQNEVSELVEIRRINEGLELNENDLSIITDYGGKHPQILDGIIGYDFQQERLEFLEWVNRKYVIIIDYIKSKESKIDRPIFSTLKILCNIAQSPVDEIEIIKPEYKLARRYCYKDDKDGRYKVFSKGFAEYLLETETCSTCPTVNVSFDETNNVNFSSGKGGLVMIIELLTKATIPVGVKFLFDQLGKLAERLNQNQLKEIENKKLEIEKTRAGIQTEQDVVAVRNSMKELITSFSDEDELDSVKTFILWVEDRVDEEFDDLLSLSELVVKVLRLKRKNEGNPMKKDKILKMESALKVEIEQFHDILDVQAASAKEKRELYERIVKGLDLLKDN